MATAATAAVPRLHLPRRASAIAAATAAAGLSGEPLAAVAGVTASGGDASVT